MQNKTKNLFQNAFNLPNFLSFIRLLLAIPLYIYLPQLYSLSYSRYIIIGLVFFAFLTDILDGYFARKMNLVTEFGKIIDPLADKILVVLIVVELYLIGEIPSIYLWIIVLRDVIIFSGGFALSKKIGRVLPSNLLGKITVFLICLYILSILIGLDATNFFYRFFFYISIISSFASIIAYALRAYETLRWESDEHS